MISSKILIVDDEVNIRRLLSKCLSDAGYDVVSVIDGEKAIQKAEMEKFDLILLDMKLPDIDGLQVLELIKVKNPSQRVVMITAYGTIETAVEAMKKGAADYLQKPFTPEEVRSIVKQNLSRISTPILVNQCADYNKCLLEICKLISEKSYENAINLLHTASGIHTGSAEIFNLLGVCYERTVELDIARRMYRIAQIMEPEYQPAQHNLLRMTRWEYTSEGIDLG